MADAPYTLVVNSDGTLDYDGIEHVHGHHFQHVANVALQQDLLQSIIDGESEHPATRAHFRAATQLGAGAVFGIDLIEPAIELETEAWLHDAQLRLNHKTGRQRQSGRGSTAH